MLNSPFAQFGSGFVPDQQLLATSPVLAAMSPINAETVNVLRFYDAAHGGTQYFTTSPTDTSPTMIAEGVGFTALVNSDANSAVVHRFFDTVHGTHFYTANANEFEQVFMTRPDMKLESGTFNEHLAQGAGDTPVYRFFDTNNGTHFFTGSETERASVLATRHDLVSEGIAFYQHGKV